MKYILLMLSAVLISSCALVPNCKQVGQLYVGMPKQAFMKIMDREPDQYSAIQNKEVLFFSCRGRHPDLIVRFIDGKIDAYGKAGDYDLVKEKPLVNIKTESHIEKEVTIRHNKDIRK